MKRYEKFGFPALFLGALVHAVIVYPSIKIRPHLEPALEVAAWLSEVAIENEAGKQWPANPDDPGSITTVLYHGMAGVVLFFRT